MLADRLARGSEPPERADDPRATWRRGDLVEGTIRRSTEMVLDGCPLVLPVQSAHSKAWRMDGIVLGIHRLEQGYEETGADRSLAHHAYCLISCCAPAG